MYWKHHNGIFCTYKAHLAIWWQQLFKIFADGVSVSTSDCWPENWQLLLIGQEQGLNSKPQRSKACHQLTILKMIVFLVSSRTYRHYNPCCKFFFLSDMAADIAQRLDVQKLVLTHYSQRYKPINCTDTEVGTFLPFYLTCFSKFASVFVKMSLKGACACKSFFFCNIGFRYIFVINDLYHILAKWNKKMGIISAHSLPPKEAYILENVLFLCWTFRS